MLQPLSDAHIHSSHVHDHTSTINCSVWPKQPFLCPVHVSVWKSIAIEWGRGKTYINTGVERGLNALLKEWAIGLRPPAGVKSGGGQARNVTFWSAPSCNASQPVSPSTVWLQTLVPPTVVPVGCHKPKELTAFTACDSKGKCSWFIHPSRLLAESHSSSTRCGTGNCGNGKMQLLAT